MELGLLQHLEIEGKILEMKDHKGEAPESVHKFFTNSCFTTELHIHETPRNPVKSNSWWLKNLSRNFICSGKIVWSLSPTKLERLSTDLRLFIKTPERLHVMSMNCIPFVL